MIAHREWPTKRVRFVTRRGFSEEQRELLSTASQVTFLPMEAIGEQGDLDLSAIRDIEDVRAGYTQFFDGDVLIAKITPCFENGKGTLVRGTIQGVGFGTTELHVLTPGPEVDGRFLYYITASEPFRKLGEAGMTGAAGQKRVSEDFVRDFRIPVPPIHQQRAITNYLDRETARLDGLVAAKERVVGLLTEKWRALITRVVTRGLDPCVPLRDPGIPWLGEIPAHWEAKRLKFTSPEITVGIVVTPAKYYENAGVPCLRSLNVREKGLTDSDLVYISEESNALLAKSRVFLGDLVAVRSGQPGTTAVVDERFDGANCIDLIIIRRPLAFVSAFLSHFLNSQPAKMQFLSGSGGAIQQHFNIETAKDLVAPIPPLEEQRAIVAHIAAETTKLDALRSATERTIALLKERRTALIAGAVTGQIEVEGAICS